MTTTSTLCQRIMAAAKNEQGLVLSSYDVYELSGMQQILDQATPVAGVPREWIKLERGNDWGTDYWALQGEALDEHGTAKRARGLPLLGKSLTVRFPDGTKRVVTIGEVRTHGSYCTQVTLYAQYNCLGILQKSDLGNLWFDKGEVT